MQPEWLTRYYQQQPGGPGARRGHPLCPVEAVPDLEALAADRVYEFAWSFNPLPLKGATGSPGNSVAIA